MSNPDELPPEIAKLIVAYGRAGSAKTIQAARTALDAAIKRWGEERFAAGKAWQAMEQLKEQSGCKPSAEAIRQAFYGDNDD